MENLLSGRSRKLCVKNWTFLMNARRRRVFKSFSSIGFPSRLKRGGRLLCFLFEKDTDDNGKKLKKGVVCER